MMRNHKSFPDKLYYKFLLCVPVLVFKENYIFHRFFEMPTGQLPHSCGCLKQKTNSAKNLFFFPFLFVNCMHTGVDYITGKASRITGFFVSHFLIFFFFLSLD